RGRLLTQPLGDRVQGPAVLNPGQVAEPLGDWGARRRWPPEPSPAGQLSGGVYRPSDMPQAVNSSSAPSSLATKVLASSAIRWLLKPSASRNDLDSSARRRARSSTPKSGTPTTPLLLRLDS